MTTLFIAVVFYGLGVWHCVSWQRGSAAKRAALKARAKYEGVAE